MALALAALASLLLAPSPPSQDEIWKQSLAEVDQAIEKNPSGVSEDSINSCRSMRKTAVLLYKMGHHARAFRRLKACRNLLEIEGQYSWRTPPTRDAWLG